MSLEQQFFQKAEVDFSTLLSFGLMQTEQGYYYSCPILNAPIAQVCDLCLFIFDLQAKF
ncbi:hypothetical protein EDC44_1057 [Cricetibacter osteomyelitidis]|uniref:Uncharacterized protein n=1 Tax=Cricetibacter osteomyelitidis TaxID=1521931 RepID=A0A4R2TG48_9PAST|nr:hypothetical protein [Cricetibacter osteomyelitidis]TCP96188.1 hypothetical protein EDC44_1057 [Cricetibacter osteomyelitidis]